jgi:hypothetical protein
MSFIEQAMALATMPVPGPGTPEETRKTFDAMPMAELAPVWCALQRLSTRDLTDGTWMVSSYFDSLPHDGPERAFELVLEVLRSETDKSVRMQLNRRIMTVLVYPHGPRMIDRIEAEARGNPNLRWLLGGVHWWGPDEAVKARIKAVADIEGWDAYKEAHERPERPIDCESMSLSELARAWIEHHSKAEKDQDGNWDTLCDYESDLVGENPDKTIDWILEILKIEDNPMMISVLAAGMLENVTGMHTIDRIEREAAGNPRFLHLLGGVWYNTAPEPLKARLDAILQGRRW